jgi:hypothetical protein
VQIRCNSFAKQTKTQRAALRKRILAAAVVVVFTSGGARNEARFVAGVAPDKIYRSPMAKDKYGKERSCGMRPVLVYRAVFRYSLRRCSPSGLGDRTRFRRIFVLNGRRPLAVMTIIKIVGVEESLHLLRTRPARSCCANFRHHLLEAPTLLQIKPFQSRRLVYRRLLQKRRPSWPRGYPLDSRNCTAPLLPLRHRKPTLNLS